MTPRQALEIVNQVTGQVQANRETHQQIQIAVAVLTSMVGQQEEADMMAALKSPESETKDSTPETKEEKQNTEKTEA